MATVYNGLDPTESLHHPLKRFGRTGLAKPIVALGRQDVAEMAERPAGRREQPLVCGEWRTHRIGIRLSEGPKAQTISVSVAAPRRAPVPVTAPWFVSEDRPAAIPSPVGVRR